jgi:hypothetical protein
VWSRGTAWTGRSEPSSAAHLALNRKPPTGSDRNEASENTIAA